MALNSRTLPDGEDTSILMQRYHVAQAHNLLYTYEELRDLGIQPEFVLALLEVFEDPLTFKPETFEHFKLEVIVDYLRKTHEYYLNKKLLEIEQSIHLLVNSYPQAHPLLILLHKFYEDYKRHLLAHIEVEERALLPYVLDLERKPGQTTSRAAGSLLTVQQFISQHHDTEKDLEDVRKAMMSYSPPEGNQTLYRILLSQLQALEKDLAIHALMEDEVLLPRALKLEQSVSAPPHP
jgi:regulator of cell morphogenesis and NO signaling